MAATYFSTLVLLVMSSLAVSADAQQYPTRPIRIISPFAPGGGTDFVARLIGPKIAASLGQQIVVENRPGAGGALIDTRSGQTLLNVGGISSSLPFVKSRQLRAIAVTTAERVPEEGGIPTVAESGIPGYDVSQWQGLIGPKGLPAPVVERMN